MVVEHAFGILKSRWRRMHDMMRCTSFQLYSHSVRVTQCIEHSDEWEIQGVDGNDDDVVYEQGGLPLNKVYNSAVNARDLLAAELPID